MTEAWAPTGYTPDMLIPPAASLVAWCLALAVIGAEAPESPSRPAAFRSACGSCHFDGAGAGGLAIDELLDRLSDRGGAATGSDHGDWLAVLRHLRSETMPPPDEPRISPADRQFLIDFVTVEAFGLDAARPDPGHVVLRRLNRSEYRHTIHDLTGLDIDADSDLPADDSGFGFDTIGETLGMSPMLVEKYLAAAERIGQALADTARGQADGRYPDSIHRVFPLGPPPPDADRLRRDRHLVDTVERLAERAFRRPADPPTSTRLVAIAQAAAEQPDGTFERGIAAALAAMLVSPRFLFRIEDAAGPASADATAVPLDEFALASRLSYFLWSSMPDEALLAAAREGTVSANLDRHVDRLIADPRCDRFIADFVGQWLQTRDVEARSADSSAIPQEPGQPPVATVFDQATRRALRRETELAVSRLLREDRPAVELLVGRETFLNASLARLYRIPDVEGAEMRLVSLDETGHRGGLLTHGSFLTVTSLPTRTSPVKRGLFILVNLLGTPVPPPPPNVPPLEAAGPLDGSPTMRQMLELHRRDSMCASCHARMDSLGLALEGYDAIGRWRGDAGFELDAPGRLPSGETFANVRDLAELIAGPRRRDFHRCLVEKLLTYALGRGLGYFDVPAVDTIVAEMELERGGFAAAVRAVCRSVPFRMRRPAPVPESP